MKAVRGDDLRRDVVHPIDARVSARSAARPDHNRDPYRGRGGEHGLQVPGHCTASRLRSRGAEVVRSGVGGPTVDRDDVSTEIDPPLDGTAGDAAAEHPNRDEHTDAARRTAVIHRQVQPIRRLDACGGRLERPTR